MSDSDLETSEAEIPAAEETRLDEDDRLRPEYVDEVLEKLEAGDDEGVRALVEPLHPADIADLFELVDRDERRALAAALAGLLLAAPRRPAHARDQIEERLHPARDHRLVERLLRREMAIEERLGDARRLGDLERPGAVEAAGREGGRGGFEDRAAAVGVGESSGGHGDRK